MAGQIKGKQIDFSGLPNDNTQTKIIVVGPSGQPLYADARVLGGSGNSKIFSFNSNNLVQNIITGEYYFAIDLSELPITQGTPFFVDIIEALTGQVIFPNSTKSDDSSIYINFSQRSKLNMSGSYNINIKW